MKSSPLKLIDLNQLGVGHLKVVAVIPVTFGYN